MTTPERIIRPAPVRRSIDVAVSQARAFEVFTSGMGRWWPRDKSIGSSPQAAVVLEPVAGGRWYETGQDGSECQWGKVLAWEPPAPATPEAIAAVLAGYGARAWQVGLTAGPIGAAFAAAAAEAQLFCCYHVVRVRRLGYPVRITAVLLNGS